MPRHWPRYHWYHGTRATQGRVPFLRCEHSISVSARHFLVVLHIETRVTRFRWRSVCLSSARRMTKLQERRGLQPFARRYQVFETRTAATGLFRCQGSRHSQLISRSWTCSCTVTSSVRKHFRCTSSEVAVQDGNRAVVASSLTFVLFTHLSCRQGSLLGSAESSGKRFLNS